MATDSDTATGGWFRSKFVVGPLVAVVTATLLAVATPLGEQLSEMLFPTSAVVEGMVKKAENPVKNTTVRLDRLRATTTTSSGRFLFENVSRGIHDIEVLASDDQPLYFDKFSVSRDEKAKRLDTILLDSTPVALKPVKSTAVAAKTNPTFVTASRQPAYQVALGHSAVMIPLPERRSGFESNTRQVTVWVDAASDILSNIERVTYYLHPTFNPSVVTRYQASDKFALSFTAWGQFEIKAKVYFRNGQVKDLAHYISF